MNRLPESFTDPLSQSWWYYDRIFVILPLRREVYEMVYDPKDFLLIQGHNLVQKGKTERKFMYCAAFFNFHWVTTLWICSNKSGLGDETLFPLKGSKAFPSLLFRRFIFRIVEASAKRERLVMNYEPQGTMEKVQRRAKPHVSPVVSFPPSFARSFSSRERDVWVRGRAFPMPSWLVCRHARG